MTTVGPFSTATELLAALDAREVSARELAELHLARIERHDGGLNAVVVRTPERALAAAAAADDARARGVDVGPLAGLPMTLKESTAVDGLPQSAGIPALASHRPPGDGPVARAVAAAGAGLLGKTNISVALGDWTADSPVYGRTVNPWDRTRTPGGSTGGGGAALAAGLTPLEIGSDIAGSVRVPAAFCGVYGHRPSQTAVPSFGGFPFSDGPNPAVVMDVQGPLARSAFDCELLLDVIAGPEPGEDVAWRLELPPARHLSLAAFRVAVMPHEVLGSTPSDDVVRAVDELVAFLRSRGAHVAEAMPDLDHDDTYRDYLMLLGCLTAESPDPSERERVAAEMRAHGDRAGDRMADGLLLHAPHLLALLDRRRGVQDAWRRFFRSWDVLVCPSAPCAAFAHPDPDVRQEARTLDLGGRTEPYLHLLVRTMWPILPGLPSTAFPAGLSRSGLPIGLEAIGPYLEDRTTLRFAQLLEREWRGFVAPPGY